MDLEYFPLHAVASLLASLFTFLVALLVQGRARLKEESRPFVLICLLISLWTFFPFASWKLSDSAYKIWVLRALYMAASAVPAAFARLIFSVLHKHNKGDQEIVFILWAVTGVFVVLGLSPWFIRNTVIVNGLHGITPGLAFHLFVAYFVFACGFTFVHLIRGLRASVGFRKNQLRYYLIGFLLAYFAGALHFLSMYFHREPIPHDLFVIAFISVLGYAIIKHQVMDVNLAARYAVVQVTFGLLLGAPLALIALWLNRPAITVGAIFLLAMGAPTAFGSMRRALTEAVDRLPLFQGRYERFSSLQNHLDRLAAVKTLSDWANQIVAIVFDLFRANRIALLVRDNHKKRFIVKASHGLNQASSVFMSLPMSGALVQTLTQTQNIYIVETGLATVPDDKRSEVEADLQFLKASVLVPIVNTGDLYAVLVLGEKDKTGAYNDLELTSLSALSREAEHALQVILSGLSQEQTTAVWAHDLVKPFTLKGSFRYLEELLAGAYGQPSPETESALKLIMEDMRFVRNNLLRLLDPGKSLDYNILPVSLSEMYARTRDRFAGQARSLGLEWVVQLPSPALRVFCDLTMLEHRVISNLVENALRYTPKGGKVELGFAVNENRFVGHVSDTGPGISSQVMEKLFEPRAQGDGSNHGLAGLGLFSAKSVIEANKGKIWVEQKRETGTIFYFELPIASNPG